MHILGSSFYFLVKIIISAQHKKDLHCPNTENKIKMPLLRYCITAILIWNSINFAIAEEQPKRIIKTGDIEVNMLSDFEGGTRFYNSGDLKMAIVMFKQGVEKREPKAMFALGSHYYSGEGVEKSFDRARELFTKSVDLGNPESAFMLSLMYGRGEGVPPNINKALGYLKMAAYGCVPEAQNQLSQLYYEGIDELPQNKQVAIAWLAITAEHEDKETQKIVKDIKANLSKGDLESIQRIETQIRSELKCSKT